MQGGLKKVPSVPKENGNGASQVSTHKAIKEECINCNQWCVHGHFQYPNTIISLLMHRSSTTLLLMGLWRLAAAYHLTHCLWALEGLSSYWFFKLATETPAFIKTRWSSLTWTNWFTKCIKQKTIQITETAKQITRHEMESGPTGYSIRS